MRERHRDEMDKLFHTAKMRTGVIKQQMKSLEQADAQFLEKFTALCRDCIIPTMKDVGEHIKKMGGDYLIEEYQEEQLKRLGEKGKPFLRLTIAVAGRDLMAERARMPSLVFMGDMYRRKISCTLENMRHLSMTDQQVIRLWPIDEVTDDKVEKAIIAYMKILVPE